MALSASIKHRAPGRMRLQFNESDFDQAELREAIQVLRQSSRMRKVQGSRLTRTLLIEAEDESHLQSALKEVEDAVVVQLKPEEPRQKPNKPLRFEWKKIRQKCDQVLRECSDNRVDFHTGVVLLMTGLGIRQLATGRFLPAGLTMVMYAAGYLEVENAVDPEE